VEQLLWIGFSTSAKLAVWSEVAMHDGYLLRIGVKVCYNLALSAGRLVCLCGWRALPDWFFGQSAILYKVLVAPLVEEGSKV